MSEKENIKANHEQESQVTQLDDLPVGQSEQDEVKGGSASPLPVLLVLPNRDFYSW